MKTKKQKPQSYPEPAPSLNEIARVERQPDGVSLLADSGLRTDVSCIAGLGWEIEVRYDLSDSRVLRQPFTGMQETRGRSEIGLSESAEDIMLQCGGSALTFSREHGAFTLSENGAALFRSSETPFRSHPREVKLWEGIGSLRMTDLKDQHVPFVENHQFSSRMTRFEYAAPQGLVLGLPGQTGEINRNGYRFELYNTDQFVHVPARTAMYQSWPVLFHQDLSGQGWIALFHDNPSRTFVDLGEFYPGRITFESVTGNTRIYMCRGQSLEEASARLIRLLGEPPLPPAWAFGYQQCRYSYMSTAEVRSVVSRFRERQIPLDAIYMDIDYMDGYRVFTTNRKTFGDLRKCLDELRHAGIKSVFIADPGVKKDNKYALYKQLKKQKAFISDKRGNPLEVVVWPGKSALPDFGAVRVRQTWGAAQSKWLNRYPFDGVWNDMNEPSNFRGGNRHVDSGFTTRGPVTAEHNLYGYYMAMASAEGWKSCHAERRAVIISRSGYPGLQRFAVLWHGDNQAWWEHMRLALETAIQYSIAGMFYTGCDLPGFTGNAPDDLALRFFQLGAFLPLFRGHSICFAKNKEPYAFGERASALIREAILLRYSLLREWYSGFEHCIRNSRSPLMPALDNSGRLVRDEALLFDKFLFAPVLERDQLRRLVYLPPGDWYAFGDTTRLVSGDSWQTVEITESTIPLYVRAGSVVVRNEPGMTVEETFGKPERFEAYPDKNGEARGLWYGDDGISIEPATREHYELRLNAGDESVKKLLNTRTD